MFQKMIVACAALALTGGNVLAQADDQQTIDAARKTQKTYEKAIITLATVIKIEAKGAEIPGLDQEHKTQCVAAIIDPSGLVVTSLTNLAPKIRLSRGGRSAIELECQVQEVKYRLTDGTEVPARIVLKDEDLDLAFLAPLKPLDKATKAKMSVLPLGDAKTAPDVLDPAIVIGRTGDELNYISTLNVGRIVAILSTPRTCYLGNMGGLGLPVFDRQGKVMGMICRCVKAEGGDSSVTSKSSALISQLILPVADIVKLVPQAKDEVKKSAESEKKAEKKAEKKSEKALPKAGDVKNLKKAKPEVAH